MLPLGRSVHASLVLPVVFSLSLGLNARTLAHRPPVTPQAPSAPAAPSSAGVPLPSTKPILAQGTNLQVEIIGHCPMKTNEPIEARLLQPNGKGLRHISQKHRQHGINRGDYGGNSRKATCF